MTRVTFVSTSLVSLLAAFVAVEPACATLRTYVATYGSGSTCTRSAPCLSLQGAHDVTDVGGEINCLDSGDFGGATILKSITIDCTNNIASTFYAMKVNAPGAFVILRGITVLGNGVEPIGIDIRNGSVNIQNCQVNGFRVSTAVGIKFAPASASKLVVSDTIITNSGTGGTGGGIVINPQPGGTAQVVLNRVSVDKNVFGIVADGSGSTGGINMTVTDGLSSGNSQDGIIAVTSTGGAPIGVYVKNTRSVNNTIGIRAIGPNVTVRVDGSSVIGNGTGLSFSGGGALLTAGNNMVQANGANGAFSGSVALQ